MKSTKFKIGDRVQYNHRFLKSIMANKYIADMKGTVNDIVYMVSSKKWLVRVLWDGEGEAAGCLESNLCKIGLDVTE